MVPGEDTAMFSKSRISNWITIPNLLSILRLMLIPVYVSLYKAAQTPQEYWWAAGVLSISCLTDGLDGWIARKYNMVSIAGKILDPLADKVTQLVLTTILSEKYTLLHSVLALLLIKETFQLTAAALCWHHGKMLPGALLPGKICTAALFLTLIILAVWPRFPDVVVKSFALLDSILLIFAMMCYASAYYGKEKKLKDIPAK